MNEDLYQVDNATSSTTSSVVENTTADSTASLFSSLPPLDTLIAHVILFATVWSFMYTLIALAYFYYYNVKYHDRESKNLKDGYENGYLVAVKLWASNLVCLALVGVYLLVLNSLSGKIIVGTLVLIAYTIKIAYFDLVMLPEYKKPVTKIYEETGKYLSTFITKLTEKPKPAGDKK
jgi:hypothetical protein